MLASREPLALHEEDAPAAIAINGLSYAYPNGHRALDDVSITLQPGEKVALIGPNGAGKSTLMLHLNGIIKTQTGSVRIGGLEATQANLGRIRSMVGLVFQNPDDQLFSLRVFDDVAYGPLYMGLPESEIRERVAAALAAVGMTGFEERRPHELSIGERKRVALATVLSMDPTVLALDEPSAGLDPRARRGLINLLAGIDLTMLVSTHDMHLVKDLFRRIIIMDGGRVGADGATEDILSDVELLERHGLEGT
jgi:cobalt transport protein ATP-binding subunit